eukprot:scaffold74267_cov95-Phaeocystis_antarctica.AAC.1
MLSVVTRESERSAAPFLRLYCAGPGFPMRSGRPGYEEFVRDSRATSCIEVCALSGHRWQRMRSARVNRSAAKRHF